MNPGVTLNSEIQVTSKLVNASVNVCELLWNGEMGRPRGQTIGILT